VKPTKEEDTPRIKILQQTDPTCQKIITYLKNQGKVYHSQDKNPKTTEKIAAGCWIDEQGIPYHSDNKEIHPNTPERQVYLPKCLIPKVLTDMTDMTCMMTQWEIIMDNLRHSKESPKGTIGPTTDRR
jgi:hypothetical protein